MPKKSKLKTKPPTPKTNKKSSNQSHPEQDIQRGLWSGAISFGLINIPVQLISAKEKPALQFSMLDPSNLSKIGYKYYNKATGEEVQRNKTVKGFEYEKGSFVLLSENDLKKAMPKVTQTIDIQNFVKLDEIDPVFFDRSYYLIPQKQGKKAYRLLSQALLKKDKVAIAKIVIHTKQHLVALMPRGDYLMLETLHYAEEVKELRELESQKDDVLSSQSVSKEIAMAEQLIESMSEDWNPDHYKDNFREEVLKVVQAKIKSGKGKEISEPAKSKDSHTSTVTDLMPLLRKSLAEKSSKTSAKQKAIH